jgi:hypothetical protein
MAVDHLRLKLKIIGLAMGKWSIASPLRLL